jgi:hypothetical protein
LKNNVSSLQSTVSDLVGRVSKQNDGKDPDANNDPSYSSRISGLTGREVFSGDATYDTHLSPEMWQSMFTEYLNLPKEARTESLPLDLTAFDPVEHPIHPTYLQLSRALEIYTSPQSADVIADFLDHVYFSSKQSNITLLRTGIIPTKGLPKVNENGQSQFLLVEWREGDGIDVFAIFKADATNQACNCLFHYSPSPHQMSGINPQKSSYSWYISDFSCLRDIFLVAQHALRRFPSDENQGPNLMQRFFQENSPTCSSEE